MADNIKDFTVTWILAGVLVFSLLTFALIFTFNNNPSALGESKEQIEILEGDFSNSLLEIEDDMDAKMNSSAKLNSEDQALGTASASSTSYGIGGTAQSKVTLMKKMISWVFAGTFGQMITKVIGGIFGLVLLYFIVILIRRII
jgi:hypothetical protein